MDKEMHLWQEASRRAQSEAIDLHEELDELERFVRAIDEWLSMASELQARKKHMQDDPQFSGLLQRFLAAYVSEAPGNGKRGRPHSIPSIVYEILSENGPLHVKQIISELVHRNVPMRSRRPEIALASKLRRAPNRFINLGGNIWAPVGTRTLLSPDTNHQGHDREQPEFVEAVPREIVERR